MYWRDVGTIDAYYDANMDLRQVRPVLNLYNRQWPLRTAGYSDPRQSLPSTKKAGEDRRSIRSWPAAYLVGRRSAESVLGRGVRVHTGAAGGGFRSSLTTAISDGGRNSGGQSSTRMSGFRRTHASATTWRRTRSIHHVTESGIVVVEGHRSTVDGQFNRYIGSAVVGARHSWLRRRAFAGVAALQ